jgi:putative addiction module component (TIGR02574 family)
MTNQELLSTIQTLPAAEQYDLAQSILEKLTSTGELPISEATRSELQRRADALEADPDAGQPWEQVRGEVFGE